jgi:hypothetical protein
MDEHDTGPPARESRTADHESGRRAPVSGVDPFADRTRAFAAGGERGKMRAGDADRDRVVELLKAAYSEGRLSKDEYDDRVADALSARTYADLDLLVADLPGAQPMTAPPLATVVVPEEPRTNGLAVASVAFGLAQFVIGPLGTLPAIVLGHMAQQQIKRTGERGAGLALAGLVLGWGAVVLAIVLIGIAVAVIQSHPVTQFPNQQFPGP